MTHNTHNQTGNNHEANQKTQDITTYMFPMHDIDHREGLFCTECNAVFYANQADAECLRTKPCPICAGQLYWITSEDQPKHYREA